VLDLGEHAITAPDHASPVADGPDGPVLLVVHRRVCLRSNGLPPLLATTGHAATDGVRTVYADSHPAGTPWLKRVHATGSEQPFPVGLPLHDQYQLIDQVRNAATRDFDTVTIGLRLGCLHVGVCRREPAAAGG
jgi:hypothetical protein